MNINGIIAQIKAEIIEDIEAGIIPRTVADFSELHDYVDANMYAESAFEQFEAETGLEYGDYINEVQNVVNDWICNGDLIRELS